MKRSLLLLACFLPALLFARETLNFDSSWRFSLGDKPAAAEAIFDDSSWRALDVPHDWSIEGDYSAANPTGDKAGFLPSGIGWYRRSFDAPAAWLGQSVWVEFEGVYMNSTVWLNGQQVGGRAYGYSSFICDLSKHLVAGRNVLAVRVDNTLEPSARWYHGCGIYGHVSLQVASPVHIPRSGVFVRTPEVSVSSAKVLSTVETRNTTASATEVVVETEIISVSNSLSVAKSSTPARIEPGATLPVTSELVIATPAFWSLESPTLYSLQTRVLQSGRIIDSSTTPFGIRSLRFDANEGLFLNGKSVKIKGVCEHQAASPFGAAVPEALVERRLRQLLAMGCNSIRLSHNPQLPAFYDLCDRLGILVMDEIFDGWQKKADQDYGARFFKTNWQQDVTDWVRRDRNHPCVYTWSIGNETGHEDKHGIAQVIHALDTTRPVTGGDVLQGVDIAGFNGRSAPNDAAIEKFHREHPSLPIVMTEEPHSFQTRGFYRTVNQIFKDMDSMPDYATPEVFTGGHSAYRSSYDNCGRRLVARACWKRTSSRPWIIGEYRWTGFDYQGEAGWAGKESLAREFNFGVIDLAGFPKDHYFLYQTLWTEKPLVHVLPHWTHPGLEGKTIPVVAYANAEEIELFLNEKSLGRKTRTELFECVWQVPYTPGEIKAIAYRAGKPVAETRHATAGAPAKLVLTTDNSNLKPDADDLALVSIAIQDARGNFQPNASTEVDLALIGPARWCGGENGDPVDITPQRSTRRKAFYGLTRGFYRGTPNSTAPVEVAALAVIAPAYFPESAEAVIALERVALRGKPANDPITLHYTTDGSDPTSASPRYEKPIPLRETTTVRVAAFLNGELLAHASMIATRGEPVVAKSVQSTAGEMGEAEDPTQEKKRKKPKGK